MRFTLMQNYHTDVLLFAPVLFFVPMTLGVAFMFWALWGFWKDERRR
jgi:hypothetical protein